jgi:cellulose synthase/poly-beta-1,6-N-acetylglucosamine synthase-like glycosyltransferase
MMWMEACVLVLYFGSLLFIFGYGLMQVVLVLKSGRYFKQHPPAVFYRADRERPMVTLQLPVYNERYVIERLIDYVAAIQWPSSQLQIQILDDSTDETSALIDRKVAHYTNRGIRMEVIRRADRKGYKAGALAYGLLSAEGDFVGIFDADFLPQPDFLERMMPGFEDENVGVMQGRWGHLNEEYSLLTGLQAFGLDAHFFVEQPGRMAGGYFLNFNGTAGIWRKSCIEDAGGWMADTLTEDLDLSYRAQLKGWKIRYMHDVVAPAELPITMPAIKSQQFRWTKGAAECAKKLLKSLWKADIPLMQKLQGSYHLLNSTVFVAIVLSALMSLPLLLIRNLTERWDLLINISTFFIIGYVFLAIFYFTGFRRAYGPEAGSAWRFVPRMIMLLAVFLGLSMHNFMAVMEGWLGKKSAFIRTPKFNAVGKTGSWKDNLYSIRQIAPLTRLEALLCLLFSIGLGMAFYFGDFALFPFHLLLAVGSGIVVYHSLSHK